MATITKATSPKPSLATRAADISATNQVTRPVGEDIAAGDMVYIKSDGKFWRANGTSANAAALAVGMSPRDAKSGEDALTIFFGVEFYYAAAAAMTAGGRLYVSATAGALDDAVTTGGTVPVAIVSHADKGIIYVLPPTR